MVENAHLYLEDFIQVSSHTYQERHDVDKDDLKTKGVSTMLKSIV